ncbi:MAG: D-glycerate dehydrogenase [Nitrososphaerota archaeon]
MAKKFNVFITAPIHEDGIKLLEKEANVIISKKHPSMLTKDDIINNAKNADALIVTGNIEKINKEIIESLPKLKIIARYGVGYDNVDVQAATKKGIYVTIAPVLEETVADHAFALLLCLARNICKANYHMKNKKWEPDLFIGTDIYNKTIGIIGLGRIGTKIAERAKGFKMKILYYDIIRKKELEEKLNLEYKNLDDLLKESDFIIISVPLTNETKNMISEREFSLMKKSAFLINIARGPIVDHEALIKALKERRIAGAGLDVFYQEPLPIDDPLLDLDNVILTPHIASNTIECRKRMSITVAEEVLRVLHDEKPKYSINII